MIQWIQKKEDDVDESDDWIYNYFGKEKIDQVKEEGRMQGREEEKQNTILNMLKEHCSITNIERFLQIPKDYIIKVAKENNIMIS